MSKRDQSATSSLFDICNGVQSERKPTLFNNFNVVIATMLTMMMATLRKRQLCIYVCKYVRMYAQWKELSLPSTVPKRL